MDWFLVFILVAVGVLLPTAYAGYIGAPYAPTRIRAVKKAFDTIKLSKDDFLIDLGAGDGKILLEAAGRGARARGYELSPIMWAITWVRSKFSTGTIHVYLKNFYKADLSEATIIFVFLMPKHMPHIKELLQKKTMPRARYFLAYAFPLHDVEAMTIIREHNCAPLYIYDLQSINRI